MGVCLIAVHKLANEAFKCWSTVCHHPLSSRAVLTSSDLTKLFDSVHASVLMPGQGQVSEGCSPEFVTMSVLTGLVSSYRSLTGLRHRSHNAHVWSWVELALQMCPKKRRHLVWTASVKGGCWVLHKTTFLVMPAVYIQDLTWKSASVTVTAEVSAPYKKIGRLQDL